MTTPPQSEQSSRSEGIQQLQQLAARQIEEGAFAYAQDTLQQALRLADIHNDTFGQAIVLHEQGNMYWYKGLFGDALDNYRRAQQLYKELEQSERLMTLWIDTGLAYHYQGRLDKAIEAYQSGLALARELEHHKSGVLLSNLGECYQDLFAMEQARSYHQQALDFAQELPPETERIHATLADIHRNLGVDLYYLGEIKAGQDHLQQALQHLAREFNPDIFAQTKYTIALIAWQEGQLPQVQLHARELQKFAQDHQSQAHLARALYLLGLLHNAQGETAVAQSYWEQCQFLAHETGQRILLWQVHTAQGQAAQNSTLADIHFQIAADIIDQILAPIEDEQLAGYYLKVPGVQDVLAHKDQSPPT